MMSVRGKEAKKGVVSVWGREEAKSCLIDSLRKRESD